MTAKVLMIGIDGAERTLLRKWALAGDLPNLAVLLQKGASADLATPDGFGDDAVWASLYTGSELGRHGQFHWRQLQPGTYDLTHARKSESQPLPFWQAASEADRCVAVLDVPKCPLSTDLNGFHIVDWLVHGRDAGAARSFPQDLASRLPELFGNEPAHFCGSQVPIWGARDYETWAENLHTSVAMKKAASAKFLTQEPWDLFITVFKEAHCSGHHFWHLFDKSHPQHSEKLGETLGGVLQEVYQAIDEAIGELVRQAGAEANIIVVSPLGMGANQSAAPLMPDFLHKFNAQAQPWKFILESPALQSLRSVVKPFHEKTQRLWRLSKYLERALPHHGEICFELPYNEMASAIRFNVAGREPNGIVEPGEALDVLCGKMIKELNGLVDARSGNPLVEKVVRLDAGSPGGAGGALPDLLVIWGGGVTSVEAYAPTLGVIEGQEHSYRTGNHKAGGVLFAAGPDIARDPNTAAADITDVAATVCKLLDVELPLATGPADTRGFDVGAPPVVSRCAVNRGIQLAGMFCNSLAPAPMKSLEPPRLFAKTIQ